MTYAQRRRAEILGPRKRKPKAVPLAVRRRRGGNQPIDGRCMCEAMKRLERTFQ